MKIKDAIAIQKCEKSTLNYGGPHMLSVIMPKRAPFLHLNQKLRVFVTPLLIRSKLHTKGKL
jgi:hypothetical protein